MLVCFGASWPFSIHKMLTTGHSEGKSLLFLFLVMVGYVFGVIHKLFYHLDVVILLYAALFFVVLADYLVCIRTRIKASGKEYRDKEYVEGEDYRQGDLDHEARFASRAEAAVGRGGRAGR